MIPEAKAAEIRELLAAGQLSQRGIARATGISRGTIANVLHGRWRGPKIRPKMRPGAEPLPGSGPTARCPVHGWLVSQPCVACATLAHVAEHGRTPGDPRPVDDDFQRHWTPEQVAALDAMREAKRRAGEPAPGPLPEITILKIDERDADAA